MPIDPELFKSLDAASYDAVAERFDYWTERVTSPLARDLVEIARLKPGEKVLDVGAGTGVVTFLASQHVGKAGQAIGIDLSEGMLRAAQVRLSPAGEAQYLRMDAEQLEFQAGSFDVVMSLFALLHFPHPERAVREMFRVVRPGGRLVVGIGSSPKLSWHNVLLLGSRLKESPASLVAPKALDRFVAKRLPHASQHETAMVQKADSLDKILRDAGFRETRRFDKSYTHQIATPDEFWDLQTTFSSVVRKRLETAPLEVRDSLRAAFLDKCAAALRAGGRLIYRNGAMIVSAVRP